MVGYIGARALGVVSLALIMTAKVGAVVRNLLYLHNTYRPHYRMKGTYESVLIDDVEDQITEQVL